MRQFLHAILIALAISQPALAQSDPPARVGRLAHIENELIFRVDRSDAGSPATLNWPISSGAILESGGRGRAEIWIGSTAFRLGDDSQLEFPVVDDQRIDVNLNGGSLAISILDRDQLDDLVVVTPDGQIRFHAPGRYRIDVHADRSTVSVQAGQASFGSPRQANPVSAGQQATRWSNGAERLDFDRDQDAFDRWVSARENATLAATTRRHVSPAMTGYQDLDTWGDWQSVPDHGTVWYPRAVADDWAPYRYGRWAWVAPWGWTWIDQAPWGFAPFHYGRWAIIHGRWAWLPGRPVARPVYAPALVAWIGNPGWNISFGFGTAPAVGWFPLGPREVYVPGHRHSPHYVRQININHVTNVTVIERATRPGRDVTYINRQSPRAVTVVPARLLSEGRTITNREIRHEAPRELSRAPLARSAPQADWVAPPPRAGRPDDDRRRDASERRSAGDREDRSPRREERNARPPITDQPADGDRWRRPRDADSQRQPVQSGQPSQDVRRERFRQPAGQAAGDANREAPAPEPRIEARPMPAPTAAPMSNPDRETRREMRETRRETQREAQRQEGQAPSPSAMPETSRQPLGEGAGDGNREARRERFRQPAVTAPELQAGPRPANAQPSPAPIRREAPAPEPRLEARPVPAPTAAPMPAPMSNPDRDARREMRETQRETQREAQRQERQAPAPSAMPEMSRQPLGEAPGDGNREARRERFRQPVESAPEIRTAPRPADTQPSPMPMRREAPAPEPRIEARPMPTPSTAPMPVPMPNPMSNPDRDSRREMREAQREVQRQERAAPPPMAAPVMPQRQEMPRPAPEVRMPAPVREMAPPPAPRIEAPRIEAPRMEAPRMEAPRPAPSPAERGERGGRGKHDEERQGR